MLSINETDFGTPLKISRQRVKLTIDGNEISVPAGTQHWFDAGERPRFTAIRLFVSPDGWVAEYTGSAIAERFPKFEPAG